MSLFDQILGLLGGGQAAAIPQGGNMLTNALQPQNAGNMLMNLPFLSKDRDALAKIPADQLAPPMPNSPFGGFQGDASKYYQPAGGASGSWDAPAQPAPMQLAEISVSPQRQAPRPAAPSQPPAQQAAMPPLPAPRAVRPVPEVREAPTAMDTANKSLSGPSQTSGSNVASGSAAKSPAFLGGLFDGLVKPGFQDRLADMYAGFASGKDFNSSISNAGLMIADGQRERRTRGEVNLTREAAIEHGLDPKIAAGMDGRSLAAFVINQQQAKLKTGQPNWQTREVNGQLVRYDENNPTGSAQIIPGVPSKPGWTPLTSLEARRARGISDDDKRPYQVDNATGKLDAIGGAGVNVNIGDSESGKLPSNTRWIDPNDKSKGVEPIPGGPGTQMPADLAARVGVGDSFLEQAPGIRRRLAAGELTGAYDRFMGGNVSASPQAEIARQMKSGTDVLMRFLTGAGMNETEAQAYAARYEVGYGDTAESAVSKFDQLEREIRAARERATQGRDDPRKRVPGAPAASPAAPGRTSNGINWSVR